VSMTWRAACAKPCQHRRGDLLVSLFQIPETIQELIANLHTDGDDFERRVVANVLTAGSLSTTARAVIGHARMANLQD